MHMKNITLVRPRENFNKNCSYEIYIGKKYLTELKNGEKKTVTIPKEFKAESLFAKIQWCGSNKMKLQNLTQHKKIIVSGNKFMSKKMPLFGAMFPLIGLMIYNLKIIPKNLGISFLIICLIGIVGTITLWRNKWLNIKTE